MIVRSPVSSARALAARHTKRVRAGRLQRGAIILTKKGFGKSDAGLFLLQILLGRRAYPDYAQPVELNVWTTNPNATNSLALPNANANANTKHKNIQRGWQTHPTFATPPSVPSHLSRPGSMHRLGRFSPAVRAFQAWARPRAPASPARRPVAWQGNLEASLGRFE